MTKPFLCIDCATTDPTDFKGNRKSLCNDCRNRRRREKQTVNTTISQCPLFKPYPILRNRLDNAKSRAARKGFDFDLTPKWILSQYEKQDGLCAYSGIKMDTQTKGPYAASLDRINSDLGYTQDNCQLVTAFVQRCKYNYSEEEFITLMLQTARPIIKNNPVGKHPLYGIWAGMKYRCHRPNHKDYKHYGAKGITVADCWMNDFYAFVEHIGPRPSPKHSVDRIKVNEGYKPGNVRWSIPIVQNNNKSSSRHTVTPETYETALEMHKNGLTLADIADRVGLPRYKIKDWAKREDWN